MITGVVAFSYATGVLSSLISNYDSAEAMLSVKMRTLEEIQKEYNLTPKLYN